MIAGTPAARQKAGHNKPRACARKDGEACPLILIFTWLKRLGGG